MDKTRVVPGFYLIEVCPRCEKTNIIDLNRAICTFCGAKIGRMDAKESLFDYLEREDFIDCRDS